MFGLGVWLRVDDSLLELLEFVDMEDTGEIISNATLAMVILGSFIFVVGILGCLGSIYINRYLLGFVSTLKPCGAENEGCVLIYNSTDFNVLLLQHFCLLFSIL